MALPPLADIAALDAWLPGVTIVGDEAAETRAGAVLAAASAQVRRQTGHLYVDEAGDLIEDLPDDVVGVTVQLAARMWANPTGATQETEGPFSVTHGQAVLTDGERDLITPGAVGGLGSVKLRAPWALPHRWCDDADEDEEV